MSLNKSKALRYNRNRGYDSRPIRLMQSILGVSITGAFNDETVRAAYDWQGAPQRMTSLAQDGMIGPNTLGCLIAELRSRDQHEEASVLAPYEHNLPGGFTDADDDPVKAFKHRTITPLALRQPPAGSTLGWLMRGCFEVKFELKDTIADPTRYEYRQLICGTAGITPGRFRGPGTFGWEATGGEIPANNAFPMIGGGLPTSFQEDGQIVNGINYRFGYRQAVAVYQPNGRDGLIDRYQPNQQGHLYECRDTFGLSSTNRRMLGSKVRIHLKFIGYVYDKLLVKAVKKLNWSYNETGIVTW